MGLLALRLFSHRSKARVLTDGREKAVDQLVEDRCPLEIDRVSGLAYLLDLRVGHQGGQRVRQEGRIGRVFVAGNEERRHGETAKHVGRPGGHREYALAKLLPVESRTCAADCLVEKVERGLFSRHALSRRRGNSTALHVGPHGCCLEVPIGQALRVSQGYRRPVYRPTRGCEHERTHLVWKGQYVFDAGPAAHRLRDEANIGQFQVPDQGSEIAGKFLRVRAGGNLASGQIAPVTEGYAGIATGEMRNLLPPGQMIAADSMRKDDCRTGSCNFVVDAASWSIEKTALRSGGGRGLGKGRPQQGHRHGGCRSKKEISAIEHDVPPMGD